ncbi:hypothetical protein [Sulfurimonas sp.]|uniref:hypothetical protein n=1 Tax=Sulfurimonas sp. TaxID=2022749 RepID=UPI002AB159E8|nr:hypothetical protein [Sulfurimonas sp.]
MSKKISLHVNGRRFDVDVEDEFAPFLQAEMAKDFNVEGNNDLKKVLHAYVKKTHELYLQEKEIQKIYTTIS